MKQILIKVILEGDEIGTTMRTQGFDQTAESSLTLIGALENIKNLEIEKLKAISKIRANANKQEEDKSNGI